MRIFLDSNFELMGQKINYPKSKKAKHRPGQMRTATNIYIYIYI